MVLNIMRNGLSCVVHQKNSVMNGLLSTLRNSILFIKQQICVPQGVLLKFRLFEKHT